MAKGRKQRAAIPQLLTVELDSITGRVRRAIGAAQVEAERVTFGAAAIQDVAGSLTGRDDPDRIRFAAAQIRAIAIDMLMGATALCATAERLATLAELRALEVTDNESTAH